jgi:hypothetical protein
MSRRLVAAALTVALVVPLLAPVPAAGAAVGEPDLDVALAERSVGVGESATLSLTVANGGDLDRASTNPASTQRVTTARSVRVTAIAGSAPLAVETGPHLLGSLPQGAATQLPFRVTVDEDAKPGTYRLPVRVEYTYDGFVSDTTGTVDGETETLRTHVTVEVTERSAFRVVSIESDVRAGERGDLRVTVENTGTETAREATVGLTSLDGGLLFAPRGVANASRYAGTWSPGERKTLTYRVLATDEEQENYTVQAQVAYVNPDDDHRVSRSLAVGVTPTPPPAFALENVQTELRVDERGSLSGTVVNTGSSPVRDAVVVLEPPGEAFRPRTVERPVGTLGPGERTDFSFEVDVTGAATAGAEQFDLRVVYATGDGGEASSDPFSVRGTVAEEREPFEVEPVNATFEPDSEGNRFVVRVTNVGDRSRSDVVVAISPRPPFSSVSPAAYVGTLDAGESERVAFSLSVDEDAVESNSPLAVNVTSDLPDQKNVRDGPYLVPVAVREETGAAGDTSVLLAGAVVALLIIGAGWWWLRG